MTPGPPDATGRTVPLSTLAAGSRARLVSVDAGAGLRARLLSMGLRTGATVSVVHNHGPGPFVVAVHGTRIVLGRGMAHKVFVEPANGEPFGRAPDGPPAGSHRL